MCSVQFSHSVVSDSLWPHEPQHAGPPCPSPTPGVHPNPHPLGQWNQKDCVTLFIDSSLYYGSLESHQEYLRGMPAGSRCGCSVAKWCTSLCDPVDCNTPGSSLLHYLLEMSIESVMLSKHLIVCSLFSSYPQPFLESESFPLSQLYTSCGQRIGASTSPSVLPMNIQGWFPLGLTGLISLQSKGLSRVFSSTTVFKSISSSVFSLLSGQTLTPLQEHRKNHSFD